jgi:DNA-binding transcriptional LysR family regulator
MVNKTNFFYKNNRLQQLRGFCYAAQYRNISRAADFMGLTHASVSLQIKALEQDLGISLFIRNGPNIFLTTEGERLLAYALPLLEQIQDLPRNFSNALAVQRKTEISIAANSTTLNFILPHIIKRFQKIHPDFIFNIHFCEQDESLEKIQTGLVDLALLPRRIHRPFPDLYLYTPIFYYTPCLITRPDHPLAGRNNLSVQEISQYDLVLPAPDLRVIPDLYDIFPQHNVTKTLKVNFINWETTRKYIEEDLAISISSDVILGDHDSLVGTSLAHLFAPVDYGVVVRRGKNFDQHIMDFILESKHLAAAMKRHFY